MSSLCATQMVHAMDYFEIESKQSLNRNSGQSVWNVIRLNEETKRNVDIGKIDKDEIFKAQEQLNLEFFGHDETYITNFTVYYLSKVLTDTFLRPHNDGNLVSAFTDRANVESPFLGSLSWIVVYEGLSNICS